MTRKHALTHLRIAGYHNDRARFTRLYIENRVSMGAAQAEWHRGAQLKQAGVRCDCRDCTTISHTS